MQVNLSGKEYAGNLCAWWQDSGVKLDFEEKGIRYVQFSHPK